MHYYINGLGDGIQWANSGCQLYCPPEDSILDIGDYVKILHWAIEVKGESFKDDYPIGILLLVGLEKHYPCN